MPLSNRPPAAPVGKVKKVGTTKRRRRKATKSRATKRRKGGKRKMTAKQLKYFGKRRKK